MWAFLLPKSPVFAGNYALRLLKRELMVSTPIHYLFHRESKHSGGALEGSSCVRHPLQGQGRDEADGDLLAKGT